MFLAVSATASPKPDRQQLQILFLSSFDPDLPDIDSLMEETETQIAEGGTPVHFNVEYLDPAISKVDSLYKTKLLSLLHEKHRGHSFDLVVAIGDEPLQLVSESKDKLFADAAVLFFVAQAENAASDFRRMSGTTGVVRELNYVPTLQLALRQNPGTRRVIVVCGSSDFEQLELKVAREQFRSSESTVEFQYWTDLKLRELSARLASLEADSIVLFLDFRSDRDKEQFTPPRILRTISKTTNRPIYGTFASFVGNGVVGGSVADLRDVGRVLGQQGVRLLKGETPGNIPVAGGEFQRFMFDWRQLRRWGISADDLPHGSSVLYWESSPWELYRWRIIGLVGTAIVQALLIMLLLITRAKRRRAEDALRQKEAQRKQVLDQLKKSEEKFSKAFRQGPLGISLTSAITHRYLDVNDTFEHFVGYSREELIGRTVLETGIWVDPKGRVDLAGRLLAEGGLRDVEFQFRRKNGEVRTAEASAELIEVDGEPCILGVVMDVTERKRAQQSLAESEKRFRLMADSAPVLMWLSGPDKLCTDFNREWLRFTGRTMQQEIGNGWTEGVHPQDLQRCLDVYSRAFNDRQDFVVEYRLRRRDGEYRWVLGRGVPRLLDSGDFAGYIGCAIDITDEKEAKAARVELSGRLIQAQEVERTRIARELHDDINQRLALLANGLEELRCSPTQSSEFENRKELHELWKLTSEIATEIQNLSHQLHPSKLQYLGLAAAVQGLCREISKQHKIQIQCVVRDLPKDLGETISLSLFRTVQESLHNVAKHSQARNVKVELTYHSRVVRLRVADDGVGFNPNCTSNHGLGLVSMRERLRLVGGEFSIQSDRFHGTRIEATVPYIVAASRSA